MSDVTLNITGTMWTYSDPLRCEIENNTMSATIVRGKNNKDNNFLSNMKTQPNHNIINNVHKCILKHKREFISFLFYWCQIYDVYYVNVFLKF